MARRMQIESVHRALDQIAESFTSGRHEHSLRRARGLKQELLSAPPVDPCAYGWARFYELRNLYQLRRFDEAFELFEKNEPIAYVLSTKNAAYSFSVASEIAMRLGRPADVLRFGRRCLELRRSDGDLASAAQCASTVCALLAALGRDADNTEFALELLSLAEELDSSEHLVTGVRRALANVRATGNVELQQRLARLVGKLRALGAGGLASEIASASWYDARPDQELLDAAFAGDAARVLSALDRGADVDARNCQGRTPLIQAADQGHVAVVRLLLERGADVDHAGLFEQTALIVASWQGHLAAVDALLAAGADPELRDAAGHTALSLTASEDQPGVVRALVCGGARIDAATPSGHTALMMAAMEGQREVVRVLLELGADRTLCDENTMTAADWARQQGFGDVARLLQRFRPSRA